MTPVPRSKTCSSASSPSGCSIPPTSTGRSAIPRPRPCGGAGLPLTDEVTEKVWAALVDASFTLGDRTLYLRMPHFHGHDVLELQHALGALGFACGATDGIFGAFTELALRKFQLNLGLPSDGIAGAYTYAAIRNLHHSWEGKEAVHGSSHLGFARAADGIMWEDAGEGRSAQHFAITLLDALCTALS